MWHAAPFGKKGHVPTLRLAGAAWLFCDCHWLFVVVAPKKNYNYTTTRIVVQADDKDWSTLLPVATHPTKKKNNRILLVSKKISSALRKNYF